jgi:hypothetical protein
MSARNSTPSLALGIGVGLVLSIAGAAVLTALAPLVGPRTALRAVIALLGLAYVLYVLGKSGERVGRITTVAVWLAVSAVAWLAGVPLVGYVLIHVGLVWLVRSLYFYSGVLPALADLGLSVLGAAFAVWAASRSGSAMLAFWCFFLTQAFHVLIPAALAEHVAKPPLADSDSRFNRAQHAAEAAIRRLSTSR